MNEKQALTKARKLLGKRASVHKVEGAELDRRCRIGTIETSVFPVFMVAAMAKNWAEAIRKVEHMKEKRKDKP